MIGKTKHRCGVISHIVIDDLKTYNPKRIANEFGQFYSTLGGNLVLQIKPGKAGTDESLAHIKRVDATLVLKPITMYEVETIIMDLPNKTSHGHHLVICPQICPRT